MVRPLFNRRKTSASMGILLDFHEHLRDFGLFDIRKLDHQIDGVCDDLRSSWENACSTFKELQYYTLLTPREGSSQPHTKNGMNELNFTCASRISFSAATMIRPKAMPKSDKALT
jgi:hypothetical protein